MGPIGSVNGLVIDCADPIELARFWSAMFATEIDSIEDDPPRYVDLRSRPGLPVLRFQRVPEAKVEKNPKAYTRKAKHKAAPVPADPADEPKGED